MAAEDNVAMTEYTLQSEAVPDRIKAGSARRSRAWAWVGPMIALAQGIMEDRKSQHVQESGISFLFSF